jgi:hypothetical protein
VNTPHQSMLAEDVALVRRLESLFKAMSTDFLLREQFVTDPAQILHEYLHGTRLPPAKAAINNQLLYSVMSNPHLLRWIRGYVLWHRANPASPSRPMQEFARAVAQHGGYHVVLAMMRSSITEQPFVNVDSVFRVILRSSIFSDATHPIFDDSTNIDPTTPGTNIDPTTPGTNIDPTTPGTNIDPTTPGTNIDPTTPGNRTNFFGAYFFSVTFESLAQYATHLSKIGAIDEISAE